MADAVYTKTLATNSRDLAGFLKTFRGMKVFGKRGMAGTLEEVVFT